MSFKQLDEKIKESIKKYIYNNGQSYYITHYSRGLDLLDTYILCLSKGEKLNNKTKISSILEKAFKLQNDRYILENYILSLIIENDSFKLNEILNDKHKLEKRFNIQSKESIVFDIVEKFINKNIDVDINRSLYDLDYIELRILYVLYKEYDIDLLNLKDEYLRYSFVCNNPRRTVKSLLALVNTLDYEKIVSFEEYILKYIYYFDEIKNDEFYRYLIENLANKDKTNLNKIFNINDIVNIDNLGMYEYILLNLNKSNYIKYKDTYNQLMINYSNYRRFNLCENDKQKKLLIKLYEYNANIVALSYFNNINDNTKELQNLVLNNLQKQAHYTNREASFIKDSNNYYLKYCLVNSSTITLKSFKDKSLTKFINKDVKILVEFENYSGKEILDYYWNTENRYYLPDEIKNIYIIDNGLLELSEVDIQKGYKIGDEVIIKENFASYMLELENIENQSEKFSMYRYFNNIGSFISLKHTKLSVHFIRLFIYNKNLFIKQNSDWSYINILEKIRATIKSRLRKEYNSEYSLILSTINLELNNANNIKIDLHENLKQADENKELIISAIQDLKDLQSQNIWPYSATVSNLIKVLKEYNYYSDMELLIICEKYVYEHKLVDEHIYEYLRQAYKNTSLLTEYTEGVLKGMNIFSKKDIDNLQIQLNYAINSHKIDNNFINNIKELCNLLGEDQFIHDSLVKNAIDYINSSKNINKDSYDNDILSIMVKIYDNNTEHYRLLESIVSGYIRLRSLDELDLIYTERLIKYYVTNGIFSEKSYNICTLIYRYKYNKKFSDEINQVFKAYLAEILKYEVIECTEENINKQVSIYTSENNKKIKLDEFGSYAIELGYSLEDKFSIDYDNVTTLKNRNYIKRNKRLFIDEFSNIDDSEFKKFAVKICVNEETYNKKILLYLLDNKDIIKEDNDKVLLKNTYLLYLKNSLKYKYEDIEKEVDYIEDFVNIYKSDLDISNNLINIVYNIKEKDIEKAIEVLAFICGEYAFGEKSISRIRNFISECMYMDFSQELIYVFDSIEDSMTDSFNQNIFEVYLKSLKKIKPQSSNIILKICDNALKARDTKFIDNIIEILLEKNIDNVLARLLIKINYIYKSKFTLKIYNCIRERYENKNIKHTELILEYLIKSHKGSINSFRLLCEFMIQNNISEESEKLIFEKAMDYINEDIVEFRKILQLLKYDKSVNYLESIKHIIGQVDDYFITEFIKKGKYISIQKAVSKSARLNNDNVLVIRIVNDQIYNCIKYYLQENENLIYKFDRNTHNIILKKYQEFKKVEIDLNIYEVIELFSKFIELQVELLRYSYDISNINVDELIIVNNKLVPLNINQINNLNEIEATGISKKNILNERVYNYSDKERDYQRVRNIKDCISKIIRYKNIESKLKKFIKDNIIGEYIDDLTLFREKLVDIMRRIKNIDETKLDIKDSIKDFNLLHKDKQLEVVNYILENNITTKEAYESIINFDINNSLKRDIYLLMNFEYELENYKLVYKKICNLIERELIKVENLDREVQKRLTLFLKSGIQKRILEDEEFERLIKNSVCIDDIDKKVLLNLLQRNIDTSIAKVY